MSCFYLEGETLKIKYETETDEEDDEDDEGDDVRLTCVSVSSSSVSSLNFWHRSDQRDNHHLQEAAMRLTTSDLSQTRSLT